MRLVAFVLALVLSSTVYAQSAKFVSRTGETINAWVYKPSGPGPFPAVIVMHDCGGYDGHVEMWSKKLVSWGYVAITPDSFGSRGHKKSMCSSVHTVGPPERVQDAMGAATYLASLPFVQKGNIGVMGFSHGGWTIMRGVQESVQWSSYGIKAAVAIYPYCTPKADNNVAIPLLILIGAKDDWTPLSRCQPVVNETKNPSLVSMVVYPNAYHSFDRDKPTRYVKAQGEGNQMTTRKLEYDSAATKDAEAQTRQFFGQHLR